jgi:hypothetical protein
VVSSHNVERFCKCREGANYGFFNFPPYYEPTLERVEKSCVAFSGIEPYPVMPGIAPRATREIGNMQTMERQNPMALERFVQEPVL